MTRVILFLLMFSAAVLAVASVRTLLNPVGQPPLRKKDDTMPATFRNVAYLLLIVLMIGVATGWLGALNG
jgi:cell division protein FtsX